MKFSSKSFAGLQKPCRWPAAENVNESPALVFEYSGFTPSNNSKFQFDLETVDEDLFLLFLSFIYE